MKKKMRVLLALAALAAGMGLFAQSNVFLDGFLASDSPGVRDVAYLVLVSSDTIGEDAGADRAFALGKELGWISQTRDPESPVSLAEYSFFVMKAFGRKGGVMFSLVPSPRYAYREMVIQGMIQGKTDPDQRLSGVMALRIMGRCLDKWGH
jgi:hypothetical protein